MIRALTYLFMVAILGLISINITTADDKVESEISNHFIIDDTDETIKKLYRNIMNNENFLKKNKYIKMSKKMKISGRQNKIITLAVYFNYEDELRKLTKDLLINDIDIKAWGWASSDKDIKFVDIFSYAMGGMNTEALAKCYKKATKLKLEGGDCIIVDARKPTRGDSMNPTITRNLLFYERDTRTLKSGYKSKTLISKIANQKQKKEAKKKENILKKKEDEEEQKKAEKKQKLLAEKKAKDKIKNINKKISLFKETELEKSQKIINYTKEFIQLYPDEFDIVEIAKKILNVKSISEGEINDSNLRKLEELQKFTAKSDKFKIYEKKILQEEIDKKIKTVDNEIKILKTKIKISKEYLSKNIDNIYAPDLIDLISKSEKTVLDPSSLDEIKKRNKDLENLISKIDNLNDKIKTTKDLSLVLKEKLKKSLSTDLAPLLVVQIEKIENVLSNLDINALEKIIVETNTFIDEEINKIKKDISKSVENKNESTINQAKNNQNKANEENKNNKLINISESEAKNPRHYNAIKNFNSKYLAVINEQSQIESAGDKNLLNMSGKTLICDDENRVLGFYFIYDKDLLSFEYDSENPLYIPGFQDVVVFEGVYTNIRNSQFTYSADENFISTAYGSMKIDRKNGDFYVKIPFIDSKAKKKGKCKKFNGDLYKLLEHFKKLSEKSEINKQKKLEQNKF